MARTGFTRTRIPAIAALAVLSACATIASPGDGAPLEFGRLPPGFAVQEPQGAPQRPRPLVPIDDGADWVQLVSGEWLRGEFDVLRDGTLEFASDELDDLEFDWDDVVTLHLARPQTILLQSGETYTGIVIVTRDFVQVDDVRTERAKLMAITTDAASEADYWSGKFSLGFTARSGNTDQTDLSAYGFLRRETPATRWDTTYNGAVSQFDGAETANNHHLKSRIDWFLTNWLFVTPAGVNVYSDRFQNIAWRVTPFAAVGYDIVDSRAVSWGVSAGPAYQYTRYYAVAPDEADSRGTGAGILSTDFDWDLTSDVEFKVGYNLTVPVPDTQKYNHHFVAMLSVDLVADFDLDVSFVWDRVNQPEPGTDGTVPEQDDYRTTVGLGYSF